MTDPRARRGLPDRWLLPPAPRDPASAVRRWQAATFEQRRSWVRTGPDAVTRADPQDAEVVGALARARLATSWRLLATAPVLGWLVLMTVWGFGRSTYPDVADRWQLAGFALGAVGWLLAAIAAAGRLRRARRVLAALGPDMRGAGPTGTGS